MKFLRKILLIFLTFLLIFTEARVNTLLSDIDYIEMLPFLIYIFYVSLYSFSSGYKGSISYEDSLGVNNYFNRTVLNGGTPNEDYSPYLISIDQ